MGSVISGSATGHARALPVRPPREVVQTSASLAQLHAVTTLDDRRARAMPVLEAEHPGACGRLGRPSAAGTIDSDNSTRSSAWQRELARITGRPGPRVMRRTMRRAPSAAGLSASQRLLDAGFDIVAAVARQTGRAQGCLQRIRNGEHQGAGLVFDAGVSIGKASLRRPLRYPAAQTSERGGR